MARVALVTGGTRGIGEAISVMLKEKGYTVVACYAGNEERAKAFTESLGIGVPVDGEPFRIRIRFVLCSDRNGGRVLD